MLTLCVTFADGDTITTRFNGTEAEAGAYYAPGKLFNIGTVYDNMQPVTELHVLRDQRGTLQARP